MGGGQLHDSVLGAWGEPLKNDVPIPADYDGDGRTDFAVYRPATASTPAQWWIRSVSGKIIKYGFSWPGLLPEDKPVVGDYDGDGRADYGVYRESTGTWFVKSSVTQQFIHNNVWWGLGGCNDTPIPADYDGDGKTDLAIYRVRNTPGGPLTTRGTWYIRYSGGGELHDAVLGAWGEPSKGDLPIPADYDGDGRADLAIFRPGKTQSEETQWWMLSLAHRYIGEGVLAGTTVAGMEVLGTYTDLPIIGDFDGDGMTDLAIYRTTRSDHLALWLIRHDRNLPSSMYQTIQWGWTYGTDIPVN